MNVCLKIGILIGLCLRCGTVCAETVFSDFTVDGLEKPVHYFAAHDVNAGDSCQTAVVIVHGWGDGVELPAEAPSFVGAAERQLGGQAVPYVIAPVFPTRETMAKFRLADDGRARWCDSMSSGTGSWCSPVDDWRGGGDATGTRLSSFDVIDVLFAALGNASKYPNLKRVVLAGFSAGGQFAGRYVAVGKGVIRPGVAVDYAPMGPSTWLRLDQEVSWLYGLKNRPRYSSGLGIDAIMTNLESRRQWNACGLKDILKKPQTSLDDTPEAQSQGANRYARFVRFRDYVKGFPGWWAKSSFHVFNELGHEYKRVFADPDFVSFCCAGDQRMQFSDLNGRVRVRPQATNEALVNPGMGWVYYHYDNANWNYGSETAVGDVLDWFPGVSTIYFRLPWYDLEPEEGHFRWDVIDSVAQSWIAAGKQIAFRFTCNEACYEWAVPKWLPKAGCKGDYILMKKKPEQKGFRLWEPEWDDPVFLEKYGNFLAAAAKKWDGNPAVAFIDVGSFGMWGEGHTGYTSKVSPERTRELAIIHAKLLKEHFRNTPIVISDDVSGGWNTAEDDPCMVEMRKLRIGLRDDSIMVSPKPHQWFHGGWARKFAAEGLPVVVESRHFFADVNRDRWYEGGLFDSTIEYQASFQGIHWWPKEFLERNRPEIDRINQRLGYRFELREVTWPEAAKIGERVEIDSIWVNVGVAAAREDLYAAWSILDENNVVAWTCVCDNYDFRHLEPTLEGGENPASVMGLVHFGWDWPCSGCGGVPDHPAVHHDGSIAQHGARVPTLAPGSYSLCVSVGKADGSPRIALPLANQIGKSRRYRIGKIRIY